MHACGVPLVASFWYALGFLSMSKKAGLTLSDDARRPVSAEDTGGPQRPGIFPAAPTSAYWKPDRDRHPSDGARAAARQPCALHRPIGAQHDDP